VATTNIGTATLDFGTGGQTATVVVSDATITAGAVASSYVFGTDTSLDHTDYDHRIFAMVYRPICHSVSAGVGFSITGMSEYSLNGRFTVRWVWSD
jgi:hypothetical protein